MPAAARQASPAPRTSTAEQQLLRLVDLGCEVIGAAVIGVELAHERAVRLP